MNCSHKDRYIFYVIIEIVLCCVPEPWPERGSTVRWPTCCREWSMCLNISTSTWAYPRSDSFLRGNQKAHAQILTYQWCLYLHKVIPFFLLGVAPCSSLHGLFSEQRGCKNSSFPVASSWSVFTAEIFHSSSANCWKAVTVLGWRCVSFDILFMQIFTNPHTHTVQSLM